MPLLSRRRVLELTSLGFGRVVLSHLLADAGLASTPPRPNSPVPSYNDLKARQGHFPGRAKAVIQSSKTVGPARWISLIRNRCWLK